MINPRVAAQKTRLTLGWGTGFQPAKHTATKKCVHRLAFFAKPNITYKIALHLKVFKLRPNSNQFTHLFFQFGNRHG